MIGGSILRFDRLDQSESGGFGETALPIIAILQQPLGILRGSVR